MLDNLSYKESSKFMIASVSLILCFGLSVVPMVVKEIMKIQIHGLCHEWASTYGSVRPVTGFLLVVTFI